MKILMINNINTEDSFIKFDYKMLLNNHKVYLLKNKPTLKKPLLFIKTLFKYYKLIKQEGVDVIYSWWCDNYFSAILSFISRKRLIYVAGGYDVSCNYDLNYGAGCNFFKNLIIKFNLAVANKIIAVSPIVESDLIKNYNVSKNKIEIIGLDFNKKLWINKHKTRKYILTVAINEDQNSFLQRHNIKGVDRFINLAYCLPQYDFLLVGYNQKLLSKNKIAIPSNLTIIKKTNSAKLLDLYNSSKIYCELSRIESFGSSLVESMLCGCIPVGINSGNIPEIIGNSEFIFDKEIDLNIICKIMEDRLNYKDPRNLIEYKYLGKRESKVNLLLKNKRRK